MPPNGRPDFLGLRNDKWFKIEVETFSSKYNHHPSRYGGASYCDILVCLEEDKSIAGLEIISLSKEYGVFNLIARWMRYTYGDAWIGDFIKQEFPIDVIDNNLAKAMIEVKGAFDRTRDRIAFAHDDFFREHPELVPTSEPKVALPDGKTHEPNEQVRYFDLRGKNFTERVNSLPHSTYARLLKMDCDRSDSKVIWEQEHAAFVIRWTDDAKVALLRIAGLGPEEESPKTI